MDKARVTTMTFGHLASFCGVYDPASGIGEEDWFHRERNTRVSIAWNTIRDRWSVSGEGLELEDEEWAPVDDEHMEMLIASLPDEATITAMIEEGDVDEGR